jgi:hypothetical protein
MRRRWRRRGEESGRRNGLARRRRPGEEPTVASPSRPFFRSGPQRQAQRRRGGEVAEIAMGELRWRKAAAHGRQGEGSSAGGRPRHAATRRRRELCKAQPARWRSMAPPRWPPSPHAASPRMGTEQDEISLPLSLIPPLDGDGSTSYCWTYHEIRLNSSYEISLQN